MLTIIRKLLGLFGRHEKRQAAGLMALVLVVALLEVAGVASVLPFLAVLANPGVVDSNARLAAVRDALGFAATGDFLAFLGAVTIGLVICAQVLKAVTIYLITRFARLRELDLSVRLLSRYLHQPYSWFLGQHSADLGARILSEVGAVVSGVLLPLLRLTVQVAVTAVVTALLFVFDPLVAVVSVAVVGTSYGLIGWFARRYLHRLGTDRYNANARAFRATQEAFGGIKDVKLLGIEQNYLDRYREPAERVARRVAAFSVVSEIPRYGLEAIVSVGMVALVVALMASGDGHVGDVLPTVGLYAFAGARLFPAIQQIYLHAASIRFNLPALDVLIADLADQPDVPAEPDTALTLDVGIELRGIVHRYPAGTRASLDGLDMSIPARATVGIIGRSGAGKTTAVDVILGLLPPQSGELLVDGVAVTPATVRAWQRMLGYVPQEIFLIDETLAANIALGERPDAIDMAAVERAARAAELHDFVISELPEGYRTPLGERGVRLSGGQRQRVGIARALYRNPPVLVLDEATSALDSETERAVMEAVHNLAHSKTIVIIAHRLSTVASCDRIFVMEDGRCVRSGPAAEILGAPGTGDAA